MKKALTIAAILLMVATFGYAAPRYQDADTVVIHGRTESGAPSFVTGKFGKLANPQAAARVMEQNGDVFGAEGNEDFEVRSSRVDEQGRTHVRLQQHYAGLKVVGADMVLHAGRDGEVYAINGTFVPGRNLPLRPTVDAGEALFSAISEAGIADFAFETSPELTYVVNGKGVAFLAWSAIVSYIDAEGEQSDRIFADATSKDLVAKHALIHRALNRATYSANNGTSLPGTLVRSEGSAAVADTVVNAAHDNAGTTYNYYSTKFGRDSYNAAGAQLKSTVHYSSNYNNAYWNGSQMVYGDGDGSTFIPLSKGFDVVAHELTHAVTQYESNLTYSNESGALNEAMSDIMAAAAEAYKVGSVNSNTWKIGEDIYTPSTSGDALRYMNDPIADGQSYDYYPTRYTGTQDNGGVHLNSGIANLAFYLLVQGGTHPRGKTSVVVPALGMAQAEQIFYRANRDYMTSSTNFQGARNATAQAATALYGATAEAAVQKAWDAVGVPGGTVAVTTLSNNVTVSSLSGSTGTWKYFKLTVPSSQTSLKFTMSGGTGDADLYVKRGATPTSSSYDYRPYLSGNNETVTVTNPVAGDWYVGIYAYSTYSGVSLNGTYSGGTTPPPTCTTYTGSFTGAGQSSYKPSSTGYVSSVSGTHTGALTGPSGTDFDLYLQKKSTSGSWSNVKSSEGSTSTENISYAGTAGTYRWRVYSYSGSGSFSLCTTKP
ncbi:MAG: M4 family metallopeptidase [Acidobacteria bacterium]|nr:M4 family metallopeptidase [Acidobacteriota bacterium]